MENYLITGARGEPHVTSSDARAFNRSYFGNGKYILDGDPLDISISPQDGEITINSGSLLWNGMHVRVLEASVSYAPPAALSIVSVYLHYSRKSNIESVTLEAFVDNEPTPILDNPDETITNAYTLLFTFSSDATSYANLVMAFQEVNSFEEMYNTIEEKIASKIEQLKETTLFQGMASVGNSLTLSENYANFDELRFYGYTGHDSGLVGSFFTENIYATNKIHVLLSAAIPTGSGTPMFAISGVRLLVNSGTSLTYQSNQHIHIEDTTVKEDQTGGTLIVKKIVGIRRK